MSRRAHIRLLSAWDEIHGIFGDGHEYDWALAGDDEIDYDEEQVKPEMKYQDVLMFRSSRILTSHCRSRSSNRLRYVDAC
jgi:hypothetical protein